MAAMRIQAAGLKAVFVLALVLNVFFWSQSRKILSGWDNIPAAPSEAAAGFAGLGDREIAYRLFGYFLQNAGNVGGNFESLRAYDYAALEKWFFLSQSLDDRANYVPFMAAYYFGGIDDPDNLSNQNEKLDHVINYLASEGQKPYPQKWRWLAQAVYLARYKQEDLPKALKLANILAALPTDTAPWARQMPAFVQLKMGNKQAAYEVMVRMLASEHDKLPAIEVNEMKHFICVRTLSAQDAAKNPLCQTAP